MKQNSSEEMSQLKKRIEYLREELNSLTIGTEKCYRNDKILEVSTTLDEIIVEYMKFVYSAKRQLTNKNIST